MSSTRFHACERFDRCEKVERLGKSVVYVNPVHMGSEDWGQYLDATREKLKYGEEVTSLVRCFTPNPKSLHLTFRDQLCPLWRHSPFSELQAFVKLFKPHRIIPNTLEPGLANLDWIAIDKMFRDCLSSHGKSIVESIRGDVMKSVSGAYIQPELRAEFPGGGKKGDVTLKNLEGGDEAIGLAARWMAPDEKGPKKLQRMQEYLPESLGVHLKGVTSPAVEARVRGLAEERLKEESQARSERSEGTDEDRYDDRGNTAHRIFAGSSFVRSERSSPIPLEEEAKFYTPVSSPRGIQNHWRLLTASPTPPSQIFNQEYADWFTPITPTKERSNPLPKTPEPKKTMNVLSPSTNKVNTVFRSTISKPHLAATPNPTSHTPLPSAPASTPSSSASASFASKRSSKNPPSPGTVARRDKRRAEREERQRIALKLGRARPDLVSRDFTEKFLTSTQEEQS